MQNGWPPGQPILVATPDGSICNCYCGGWAEAGEPTVAVPEGGARPMRTLAAGDTVSAYDTTGSSQPRNLAYSEGTVIGAILPEMAHVSYQVGAQAGMLAVCLIHTFLRAGDRKLIQAQMLRPGDQLARADGTVATVTAVQVKDYSAGLWNIATTLEPPTSLDGHLIAMDGMLSGDFTTQVFYQDLVRQGLAIATDDAATIQQDIKAYGEAMGFIAIPQRQDDP
jgi:hypothetical protein